MTPDFRHATDLQVRFRDVDAFGHVNNAVFFSYLEQARIRYLIEVLEPDEPFERMPLILARVELDFRAPIFFGDALEVASRVDWIGHTSFAMSHRITARDERQDDEHRRGEEGRLDTEGRLVGESATVLVAYDYEQTSPMPVPEAWRVRMTAYEGRALARGAEPVAAAAGR